MLFPLYTFLRSIISWSDRWVWHKSNCTSAMQRLMGHPNFYLNEGVMRKGDHQAQRVCCVVGSAFPNWGCLCRTNNFVFFACLTFNPQMAFKWMQKCRIAKMWNLRKSPSELRLNEEASRAFNAAARQHQHALHELIVCCCCINCHPMLKFHFLYFFNFISIPYLLFWFQCFQLWIIWGKTITLFTLTVCDVSPFHFDYYSTFGFFCVALSCETQSLISIIVICWVMSTPTLPFPLPGSGDWHSDELSYSWSHREFIASKINAASNELERQ